MVEAEGEDVVEVRAGVEVHAEGKLTSATLINLRRNNISVRTMIGRCIVARWNR